MSNFALSQEQLEAATSDANHLMIIAPPGCGKTEVLAHRAKHLIGTLLTNQRVLALTFTNRAKSNIEERLRDLIGRAQMRRHITVRNFHGLAAEIILAHGRNIGLNVANLALPKTSTLRKAMREAGGEGKALYDAESLLKNIKRNAYSDSEVLKALEHGSPSEARDLAEKVERRRQDANQLHYEDLLRHAQRLIRIPAIARLYNAHFGAVFVDEFQDLSLQQLDLAQMSCPSQQTFAGDPLQSIFSWAGADTAEVTKKLTDACGEPFRLRESYRSSPTVLNTVNSISEEIAPGSSLICAKPDIWPNGGSSAGITFQNQSNEAQAIQELTSDILSLDPEMSVGIISRASWRRQDIDRAFETEKDFPVQRWDLAIQNPTILALIQSTVSKLPRGASIEEARLSVLDAVDPAETEVLEQADEAFTTLEESNAATARSAIKSIRASVPNQAIGPGVHLLNAHTGKGQQFDWVFVVGLEEKHLPDKRSSHGQALEEEQRVLG